MSAPPVEKIADAVLYEGYLLYPYRSSAVKNRQRWNFGIVYPHAYSESSGGTEPFEMQTECLATGQPPMAALAKIKPHIASLDIAIPRTDRIELIRCGRRSAPASPRASNGDLGP